MTTTVYKLGKISIEQTKFSVCLLLTTHLNVSACPTGSKPPLKLKTIIILGQSTKIIYIFLDVFTS